MIECYFDDSGTHSDSKIAVWGGVIGEKAEFEELEKSWKKLLADPLPHKKILRQFHLANLAAKKGDFIDYNQGECDLLRYKFRTAIVESGVVCFACIVAVEDWNRVLTPVEKRFLGEAKNMAFAGVFDHIFKILAQIDEPIWCHFDQGAQDIATNSIITANKIVSPEMMGRINLKFSAVEAQACLQAADTVAYEAYRYGLYLIDAKKNPENPHFIDLRNRTNVLFFSLHEQEISSFIHKWRIQMRRMMS